MDEQPVRQPGRPRSERARLAVLDATLALAGEVGPAGLSMEAIAKRAGVSKETLYRWWRSKTEVILDAMVERGQASIPLPDSGSLPGDAHAFLRSTVDALDRTTVLLLRAVAAAAATDRAVAHDVRDRFLTARRAALGTLLDRAVARGEIPDDRAAPLVDFVYGSLWYRLIFDIGPLDHSWADETAAAITASPRRPPLSTRGASSEGRARQGGRREDGGRGEGSEDVVVEVR
ncbi:TetR family transcriptional regulator [Frankia sp. AiPs1]|uniref:TetR/AcrR family transcriptional regulator n=1 Tax=Frankia sp. AiPa1 TaxID=573492 RepID=UPI00202B285F|nr:TetR/AcrR family transcriptional regulator [Frankia sp. AiPa1]MCL9760208.1 TetR/AcrR family transcriptional regulator [Frankia sp. AiPa1]